MVKGSKLLGNASLYNVNPSGNGKLARTLQVSSVLLNELLGFNVANGNTSRHFL